MLGLTLGHFNPKVVMGLVKKLKFPILFVLIFSLLGLFVPTQVSDPDAVINFFSVCVTAYVLIEGLSNIFLAYIIQAKITSMGFIKDWLLLFSLLFFSIFFIVLFVTPTPFESVNLIARLLFLGAIVVITVIVNEIVKRLV